jgi:curved DNA-binding protein CbpA
MLQNDFERIVEWSELIEDSNYYEILGVLEIADAGAIKQAFHDFAQAFHPDTHPNADEVLQGLLRSIFQRGVEAYRTLSSEARRAEYDMALARGQLRLSEPAPATDSEGVKSLTDLCQTKGAKLAAGRADRLISEGKLAEAKTELQMALHHDGADNPELAERLEALELALFAKGE